jgi:hypothetical protein
MPAPMSDEHLLADTPVTTRRDSVFVLAVLVGIALSSGLALRAAAGEAVLPGGFKPGPEIAQIAPKARAFLGEGVWRVVEKTGACEPAANFQAFVFTRPPSVEVGQGAPGTGETVQLLKADATDSFVSIETKVCAPVGCNHTIERYKVIDANTMQEWDFEGRLPGQAPYVLLEAGKAPADGTEGRVFRRCDA